jgi:putative ATP-dependent endonuclease of OLD family
MPGAYVHISRVAIKNFANFKSLDVETSDSIVIVGENKAGKSNFIRALQLVLDPGLSERDRQLGLEDFWDGLDNGKLGATVEVAVEFTGFDDNDDLIASLNDCLVAVGPPTVARLTYRYRPKVSLQGEPPKTLSDYEYVIFGGEDENNDISSTQRREFPLEVQAALRDAEKDLARWRRSPLRPLIEELTLGLDEVVIAAERIGKRLLAIVGSKHTVPIELGLAPAKVDTLLRNLRILIDNGVRGIGDASLGTANLIFLALKSLELDKLVSEGDRSIAPTKFD